jgi:4-amino-4-deoxy-L-arabinose transferase-like glycosyltransferase
VVLGGLMPWTAFLLLAPRPPVRAWLRRAHAPTRDEIRLLLWAGMPLVLFTLSIGKQPRYVLPVLPPIAMLLAHALVRRIGEAAAGDPRARRRLRAATWVTAGLFALLAAVLVRAQPLFPDIPAVAAGVAAAGLAAGALALGGVAARDRWPRLPALMTGAAGVLLLAVLVGALGGARPAPVERIAAEVVGAYRPGDRVAVYRAFTRNLVFYTGIEQIQLFDDEQALTLLRSDERVLLVAPAGDLERLERLSGVPLTSLAEARYLNTAALRLDMVLFPLPEQDLETVRLATNR